jgi:hypothetical protein
MPTTLHHAYRFLVIGTISTVGLVGTMAPASAIEDFRDAIQSIAPHIVVVRRTDHNSASNTSDELETERTTETPDGADQPGEANEAENDQTPDDMTATSIMDAREMFDQEKEFQHALRIANDLIATVDPEPWSQGETWEILSRRDEWEPLAVVGRDRVSRLVVLRADPDLLDEMSAGTEGASWNTIEHWPLGETEIGLPTAVIWYENGAPCAKATMVAATGTLVTRGMARLDHLFEPFQIGAPVLDASGHLLGLVGSLQESRAERALPQVERHESVIITGYPMPSGRLSPTDADDAAPRTLIRIPEEVITPQPTADLIAPARMIARLHSEVEQKSEPVTLEHGLMGIYLGQGDGRVSKPINGGAAATLDIRSGDKIVGIDDFVIRRDIDILRALRYRRAGDTISVRWIPATATESPATTPEENSVAATANDKVVGDPPKENHVTDQDSPVMEGTLTLRGLRPRESKELDEASTPQPPTSSQSRRPIESEEQSIIVRSVVDDPAVPPKRQAARIEKPADNDSDEVRAQLDALRRQIEALEKSIGKID